MLRLLSQRVRSSGGGVRALRPLIRRSHDVLGLRGFTSTGIKEGDNTPLDDSDEVEVSGHVVAKDDAGRLVMIQPDFTKKSTRQFRPGSLVQMGSGEVGCLAFELAGYNFAILLPETAVHEDLLDDPSCIKGTEVHISSKQLHFHFDGSAAAGGSVLDCFGKTLLSSKQSDDNDNAATALAGSGSGGTAEAAAAAEREIVQLAFNPAPGQFDRQVIRDNIHTGVTALDALTPFGRGQSMLVHGEAGTGKSSIAMDVVLAQHEFGAGRVKCVYAATHADDSKMSSIVSNMLAPVGEVATVIASSSDDGDEGALFAALSACALGEHHRDRGDHSMVILDEVSGLQRLWDKGWQMAHAHLGRETTPPVEIGQLRSWYMPLLQRAAKLNDTKKGGGSMSIIAMVDTPPSPADHPEVMPEASSLAVESGTGADARPLTKQDIEDLDLSPLDLSRLNTLQERGVQVDLRMLRQLGIRSQKLRGQRALAAAAKAAHPYYNAYQASKVHVEEMSSIADGHIRLTPGLKALGVNPPLDPQNSLTRIGIGSRKEIRDHRSKAMQKVAARLRIDVTSALDAVKLNSSTAEVAHANRQLAAWRSALSQGPLRPLPLHEQVVLLFVAAAYHDDPVVAEALKGGRDSLILRHMRSYSQPLLDDIRNTGDFSVASAKLLDVSLRLFSATAGTIE